MTVPLDGVKIVELEPGRVTLEIHDGSRHSFDYDAQGFSVGDVVKVTTRHSGELIALEHSASA